uniref:Putative secreted protein n=1 Tax=Anopheles triannulatus TaxID=58253 RepID=A0A2M4B4U8_9DIPT
MRKFPRSGQWPLRHLQSDAGVCASALGGASARRVQPVQGQTPEDVRQRSGTRAPDERVPPEPALHPLAQPCQPGLHGGRQPSGRSDGG